MRKQTRLLILLSIVCTLLTAGCGNGTSDSLSTAASTGNIAPAGTSEGATQTTSGFTKTIDSVLNQLRGVYLFPDAIPEDASQFETVEMLIDALDDPFTIVLPDFGERVDVFFGGFRGIGVQIQQIDDITFFPVVFPGQPATAAGVQANDILLGIDSEWVEGKSIADIVEMIQREVGEPVHLRIQRGEEILTLSPMFSEFQRSSVFGTPLTDRIAYIGVFTFLQQSSSLAGTDGEIREFLLKNSSPLIILDLRDNLGGTLEDSIQTADLFIASGTLIQLFDLNRTDERQATPFGEGEGRTVVLLQNGQSASASEIVIASLRDNLGSHIIGTQSFGKAVSQNFFRFSDDPGGLQLVTGGIRSPNGEDYNKVGIAPDDVVEFEFDPETFEDTQLNAAIAFARSLLGEDPNSPIELDTLKKIRAFREGIHSDASPKFGHHLTP